MLDPSQEEAQLRQVMCGLRNMMSERIGIQYETSVMKYLKNRWDVEEISLKELRQGVQVDLREDVEQAFSTRIDESAWHRFWGLEIEDAEAWASASRQTFGHLAHFILERLGPTDFNPIRILGRQCETAGAFRGIEVVANQVDPFVKSFAPSTPITQRFVGENLRELWQRLRWRSENRIPQLQKTLRSRIVAYFGTLTGLTAAATIGMSFLFSYSDEYLGFFISCIMASIGAFVIWLGAIILAVMASPLVARLDSGIPHGIHTFGDLARLIGSRY